MRRKCDGGRWSGIGNDSGEGQNRNAYAFRSEPGERDGRDVVGWSGIGNDSGEGQNRNADAFRSAGEGRLEHEGREGREGGQGGTGPWCSEFGWAGPF
jgi:hypothetical protein